MSVRVTSFRWCMVIGACALLGVAVYYLVGYVGLNIAVENAGLTVFYRQAIRALWIGYTLQASLLGLLFIVAALRPHWISRPVLVICGLLPLAEGLLPRRKVAGLDDESLDDPVKAHPVVDTRLRQPEKVANVGGRLLRQQ